MDNNNEQEKESLKINISDLNVDPTSQIIFTKDNTKTSLELKGSVPALMTAIVMIIRRISEKSGVDFLSLVRMLTVASLHLDTLERLDDIEKRDKN